MRHLPAPHFLETTLEALENQNGLRFIRRLYTDQVVTMTLSQLQAQETLPIP